MGPFSIWLLMGILALAGAMFAIDRMARRAQSALDTSRAPDAAQAADAELAGVDGWLFLLITILVFIGPSISIARMVVEISSMEAIYPELLELGSWHALKYANWVALLMACAMSIYAGIGLARKRDLSVVKQAKIVLWIKGPLLTVVTGKLIPLLIIGKGVNDATFYLSLTVSVMVAIGWTGYLTVSRRVRATYAPLSASAPASLPQAETEG